MADVESKFVMHGFVALKSFIKIWGYVQKAGQSTGSTTTVRIVLKIVDGLHQSSSKRISESGQCVVGNV